MSVSFDYKENPAWRKMFEEKALGLMTMCVTTYAGTVRQTMRNSKPSGRTVWSYKLGRWHRRSAPGQPPAIETGQLIGSIEGVASSWKAGVAGVTSVAASAYALALEFGSFMTHLLPRPYWRTALPIASRTVRQALQGKL